MDKLKKALPFIFPPLAVLLIMGFAFYRHGLYPFGDGTVSWCDMSCPLYTSPSPRDVEEPPIPPSA